MKFGIMVFPGTNCDQDCFHVVKNVLKQDVDYLWHKEDTNWDEYQCIILPGGFSYGDYLRPAAMARFAKALVGIQEYVDNGGLVLGICNGFQLLLEMGLLPGAMIKNSNLEFICKDIYLKVNRNNTAFTSKYSKDEIIRLPIAHAEGHYFIDDEAYIQLKENKQIVLRYCDSEGKVTKVSNPNGSKKSIAGICNKAGNVFGLMPHPERASEELMGGTDGYVMFDSIIRYIEEKNKQKEQGEA